ncbi:MAG: tetratricopeptide repeat protein [Acidobacteria bacterium]|nr:tetratricopeptide repeat protein [Acidobacteriota bacterium]
MRVLVLLLYLGIASAQDYVGSKACSTCHKQIHEHWIHSSMGRSMSPAPEHLSKLTGELTIHNEKLQRDFAVFADKGQLKQRESGASFRNEHPLAWAIGSGGNGLSFIVQRGEHLFQAPLSFYSRVGRWDLSPGYEFADYGFNRTIASGCINCHSGRPQPVPGTNGQYQKQPFAELAIGCENCHGPGRKHIALRGAKTAIVNPAKLPRERADEICMNCHQAGDTRILQPGKIEADYRPGMALNDVVAIFKLPRPKDTDLLEHHESMHMSKCYEKSTTMSCLTCHSPHAAKIDYNAKCLSCHSDHPAGGGPDCVNCHMPKRDVKVIAHSALTNHRIVRKPDQPLPPSSNPGSDLIHINRTGKNELPLLTRLQAYGQMADREPTYYEKFQALLDEASQKEAKNPLVLASLGRRALRANRIAEAITHLQAAREQGSVSSTTFEDLGEALSRAGRLEESAQVLQQGIQAAPYTAVLYKSLALRFIQLKRFEEAKQTLTKYVDLFPEDDFIRKLLAQVSGPR